uniref:Uncharacterized protein n=1 Tax=viral metagenome TaxID=1070528 RepID=A0A6C0JRS9_9ZZZZ
MCRKCHVGITDEQMEKSIMDALEKKNFEEWNDVSVSHIILAASGVNGKVVQNKAKVLLEEFFKWGRKNGVSDKAIERIQHTLAVEIYSSYILPVCLFTIPICCIVAAYISI